MVFKSTGKVYNLLKCFSYADQEKPVGTMKKAFLIKWYFDIKLYLSSGA